MKKNQKFVQVPGCGKQCPWTYSGINEHLKSHNLSMGQYEEQFLGIPKSASKQQQQQQQRGVSPPRVEITSIETEVGVSVQELVLVELISISFESLKFEQTYKDETFPTKLNKRQQAVSEFFLEFLSTDVSLQYICSALREMM